MSDTPLIRVPEFILFTHVKNLINFIRLDDTDDTVNSYLYKLANGVGIERYDYFQQLKEIFITRDNESLKYLEVDLMFNNTRDKGPTIHVTCPSESPGQNALGNDEGSRDNEEYYEEEIVTENAPVYTRRYVATYDLVIVSDNSNECVAIYHLLKALINATRPELTLLGLENIKESGNDLTPYNELMPKMFMRTLRLSLEYETSTLVINKAFYPADITVTGVPQTTYYNQLGIGTDNL